MGRIEDYSYKPRSRFLKTSLCKDDSRFYGVELEIESENVDDASDIASELPFVYNKWDGSLSNGFEIVTHPMTWGYWNKQRDRVNKVLERLSKCSTSYCNKTCGMHIHVSKKDVGTWHMLRILNFVFRNQDFIYKVSQRRSRDDMRQWAAFDADVQQTRRKAKQKRSRAKYEAVHLSPHTLEFRLFKGNLKPRAFWKNLEFVKALMEFTECCKSADLTVRKFVGYVGLHNKVYPNLHSFLQERNVV